MVRYIMEKKLTKVQAIKQAKKLNDENNESMVVVFDTVTKNFTVYRQEDYDYLVKINEIDSDDNEVVKTFEGSGKSKDDEKDEEEEETEESKEEEPETDEEMPVETAEETEENPFGSAEEEMPLEIPEEIPSETAEEETPEETKEVPEESKPEEPVKEPRLFESKSREARFIKESFNRLGKVYLEMEKITDFISDNGKELTSDKQLDFNSLCKNLKDKLNEYIVVIGVNTDDIQSSIDSFDFCFDPVVYDDIIRNLFII